MDEKKSIPETGQIGNMSKLDFLMLLWEARIVDRDYAETHM